MRAERGFTLLELLIVLVLTGTIGMIVVESAAQIRAEDDLSKAYTQDVGKLRKLARTVRTDLQNGASIEELKDRLDGEVDAFEVTTRGDLADVRLVVGGELRFTVRRRNR